jgi:small subunit ribosomal protein S7
MIKVFNRWDVSGIKIMDQGLQNYINLDAKIVPKTGARFFGTRFHKSRLFIVERFINKLMVPGHKGKKHKFSSGHNTGKAQSVYDLVENSFKIIEKRTNKNPIEVFVKAIENAAPREEVITVEYGGARYPKAVEVAPQRRVDLTIKFMIQGIYEKCFNKKKSAEEAIADEVINAYNLSNSSNAISKKIDLERQADASR